MQFIYQGRILSDGETAIIKTLDGITDVKPLDLRLDLRNSSPTGFSWGYLGSGPVQSAVAIIASALGEQYVDEFATTFAREVIASFTWDDSKRSTRGATRQGSAATHAQLQPLRFIGRMDSAFKKRQATDAGDPVSIAGPGGDFHFRTKAYSVSRNAWLVADRGAFGAIVIRSPQRLRGPAGDKIPATV